MTRPVDFLVEFLEAEQARGVSHLLLDDEAREALRELFNRAKAGAAGPRAAVAEAPVETVKDVPELEPVTATISITGTSRSEQLDSLRMQAESWGPARSLGSLRDVMVFATGSLEARIMLIADAPGYHEERQREPFVGPAGEKLDGILKAMGLSRDEVYISNLVKFRPSAPRQTTNNRQSTPEEMAAFLPILRAEIGIVRPECIVALGETAAQGLLGLDSAAPSMRESWHDFEGTPVRVSLHPSRLLQTTAGTQIKRQLWEDMLAVMEKLAMPVSEKQRGFFLQK